MRSSRVMLFTILILIVSGDDISFGQNPLIMDQFTADPSARVFEGKVYVYPSHDIPCGEGQGYIGFCMADYHVFSSADLVNWEDHGVILSQQDVPWVDSSTYSMWAPDCIYRNGKYYFYFPAIAKDKTEGRGRMIGVAVSDHPYGPFIPEPEPIKGMFGIDPNPFIDSDGQAYIYWGGGAKLWGAKLKDNMKELAGEPVQIMDLPPEFKEGPYLFERNGHYYFTFPYVPETTERLVYAMGDNPLGPFEYEGVIMDESPTGCWTNHHSIIEYNSQWYLFYHHNDLSPEFDKNRSICADSLFFNSDGTIQKVIPSKRGVGLTRATENIQVDRYSLQSPEGVKLEFLDQSNKHLGWKVTLEEPGAWLQYNRVDFHDSIGKRVKIRIRNPEKAVLEIRCGNPDGEILAVIDVKANQKWSIKNYKLLSVPEGNKNIVLQLKEGGALDIDWISFE